MAWWSGLPRFQFGDSPQMADELLALVIAGRKTATCGAVVTLTPATEPTVGSRWIVESSFGEAACVIETTETTIRRFGDVEADFARDEGEGDLTLESWRAAHERFFTREGSFAPDMELLCERFRLVEVIVPETAQ